MLETYQYRCSKSDDSRALSNAPRYLFIKFSVKENLKRTANRIVYVKSNLPVRLALCRGTAPLCAEVLPRSVQRYCPARGRGTAPLGVEVPPRSGCGCIPCSGCSGIPRSWCGGTPRSWCGGTPRSGCGGIPSARGVVAYLARGAPLSRAGMANRQTWSYRFNFVFRSLVVFVGRYRNSPERYN